MHGNWQSGVGANTMYQISIAHLNKQAVPLSGHTQISMYSLRWEANVKRKFAGGHGDIKSGNDHQAAFPHAPMEPPTNINHKQRRELRGVQDS